MCSTVFFKAALSVLINGVFLLALCFSIFLEAIQRFFDIHGSSNYQNIAFMKTDLSSEISNPRLIIIVGSFGLASNIFGLFLFHGLLTHTISPPLML